MIYTVAGSVLLRHPPTHTGATSFALLATVTLRKQHDNYI